MLHPTSIRELQDMVLAHDQVLAVGGETKNRLSTVPEHVHRISMRQISGITEYEPSEYTFTAYAGTPVEEIHQAVQAKGQFLPCSAMLRDSGATLGGAIASGLSGPGRFRFGGLRDFLLGIKYVSGEGKLITSGGKVVKNAAGFDLPKFMVGGLGRYGILTEVTFKVFPKPSSLTTVVVACKDHEEATERICQAAASRWELYAIDYDATTRNIYLRVGGPELAVGAIVEEICQRWAGQADALSADAGHAYSERVRKVSSMHNGGAAAKVPLSPKQLVPLQNDLDQLGDVHAHYTVAGNVAGILAPDTASMLKVSDVLARHQLRGMTFIGNPDIPLWLGIHKPSAIETAVKMALDPQQRFPQISDH